MSDDAFTDEDRAALAMLESFARRERDGELIPTVMGPWSGWLVASAVQLACRHPGMSGAMAAQLRQIAQQIADALGPQAREFHDRGWDPSQDWIDPGAQAQIVHH